MPNQPMTAAERAEQIVSLFKSERFIAQTKQDIDNCLVLLADRIAQALAPPPGFVRDVVVEFKNDPSRFGAECWTRTPRDQSFADEAAAIKWIADYGTDVEYRVTRIVAGPMSVRAARESAQAARGEGV